MLQLKKGIRLETLQQPLKQSLVTAARIGADGVEINARTQLRPAEMSRTGIRHLLKMMEDLNLKVAALHYPTRRGYENAGELERRIEGTKAALSLAYDLGATSVVNHIGLVPEDQESVAWKTMHQALTDIAVHSQKCGAWLTAETGSQPAERLAQIIGALPLMAIGVDFDPGNILINGFSPDESMKLLAEHVMGFRVRDAVRDLAQGRGLEVQLGRGSIDWPSLLGQLEQKNYAGYMTIDRTAGADEVVAQSAESMEYLTNLFG
ncbi:MAG: sugar phosphate isomerase/epimerase family protein [Planctomycetota bacterium]